MKLAHPELECQFDFSANNTLEWVIENPELLSKYIQELYLQIHGKEGGFVLSAEDQELSLEKAAEIIIDPFAININDRKILNKLYIELSESAVGEEMYLQTQEVVASLQKYFFLLEQYTAYVLEEQLDINVIDIFKILGIKLADDAEDFFENLLGYIKISASLMQRKLFVFVNLGGYLNETQFNEVIKIAAYNEIKILFIECAERPYFNKHNLYIIDKDSCEIFG